jgi:hypothetical protein
MQMQNADPATEHALKADACHFEAVDDVYDIPRTRQKAINAPHKPKIAH